MTIFATKNQALIEAWDLNMCHRATENQSDMMTTNEMEMRRGHDTTMCGDPKAWYPMRVTYSREQKIKAIDI